jgi:hypothetical protein
MKYTAQDMKIINNREDFPFCIRHYEVLKGICVGGCIDPESEIKNGRGAHAHVVDAQEYRGWICLSFAYQLRERLVLLHEMAHLLCPPKSNHSKIWRKKVVEIGGTTRPIHSIVSKNYGPAFYPGFKKGGKEYYPSDRWVRKHFVKNPDGSITKLR